MIYIAAHEEESVDASSDQYTDTTSQDDCDDTTLLYPSVGLIRFLLLIRLEFYYIVFLKTNKCVCVGIRYNCIDI